VTTEGDAMPSVKISISRRQLLQVGVVGSAVLSTAGLLGGAGQIFAAAPAGGEFLALSSAGRDILRAIAPVVLEGSLPSDAAERADSVEQVLRAVDFYLAHLPESVQAEAEQAFSLLSLAPVRILLAGVWQRWPEAAPAEVAKFLNAWRESSFELLRSVYVFLQSMVSIGWYDQPRAWVPMGYAGPPASSLSLPLENPIPLPLPLGEGWGEG
jgi:hypothetical protein